MNPGELDKRIELDSRSNAQGDSGEVTSTWSVYGKRWAKFEPVSINENLQDEMVVVSSTVKFTMRYERINEADYRIRYNNKVYNIDGISELERRQYMELICNSTSTTNFKT